MSLPKIALLATGGTIAGRGADPTKSTDYRPGMVGVEELLGAIPQLAEMAEIHAEQFCNIASSALSTADLLRLTERLNYLLGEGGMQAAVITHGTDVMEETAYFLNLTVKSAKPVIITGSMRPSTAISADGPMNIIEAVRVAIHPDSYDKGVLVVLNDEIHAARDVTKGNAQRLHTFVSRELGPLGIITGDHIDYYRLPLRKHTHQTAFVVEGMTDLPRVDLVTTHLGNDSVAIDAYIAAGAKGIVVAAAGGGATTPAMREGFQRAIDAGLIIVIATRTGSGMVSGRSGATIGAGNLNPYKARILLSLALAHTQDPEQIDSWFSEY